MLKFENCSICKKVKLENVQTQKSSELKIVQTVKVFKFEKCSKFKNVQNKKTNSKMFKSKKCSKY
jgi:hypothetical protein